jgi:RNA polymerase sigma factor (TIGR02999 family)
MWRILIERARKRQRRAQILGPQIPMEELTVADSFPDDRMLALDATLEALEQANPQIAEVVKLRFFAGLKMPELASAIGIPLRTAERHWKFARTWLHRELEQVTSE